MITMIASAPTTIDSVLAKAGRRRQIVIVAIVSHVRNATKARETEPA
ncbi:MAG TPA: hypothetical protein VMS55_19045 [Myxococcota bacterium]|nr:hypothetical protein [Myxococcota bacterium]